MNFEETKALYDKYVIANYNREPMSFVHAENSRLTDSSGKEYIDLLSGLGTSLVGHRHPRVARAIDDQVARMLHIHNNYYWESQGILAGKLVDAAGIGGKAFFCNSGTEANEVALKLARLCAEPNRRTFVSAFNSFHGRTYAALSVTGQDKLKANMGPMVAPVRFVEYNNIDAMEDALDETVCAVILEPVQGEGGIRPANPEYLAATREFCTKNNVLLIYDEIQCGMGRTGNWFAYQTLGGSVPDIITVAKGLSGGMQIGAMVARDGVHENLKPGTHGSTFGGHPVSCAAGVAVFEAIEEEGLLDRAKDIASDISIWMSEMKQKHDFVKEFRQCGLMAAIELTFPTKGIFQECGRRSVILNSTKITSVRFLPPMTIPKDDLQKALGIVEEVMVDEFNRQE